MKSLVLKCIIYIIQNIILNKFEETTPIQLWTEAPNYYLNKIYSY